MYFTACPFCHLEVPSSELQWHANNHFEDEQEQQQLAADSELAHQLAADSELAHQLAFAPPSPPPYFRESSTSNSGNNIHQKISNCSIDFQKRGVFRRIEGGLMALLKNCLESEPENTTSILSGYVDHFQSTESEDVGWGCGWRNIQMLSSHLLVRRPEAREVLFGGLGFVPDIPSLQRWLEVAWKEGFDEPGAEHFDHKIYGSKKWIGTTECAALLRSFGVRAMVVDFGPKELESLYLSVPGSSVGDEVNVAMCTGGKRRGVEVYGPMDRYVLRKNHSVHQGDSSVQERASSSGVQLGGSLGSEKNITRKNRGQQVLVDWVWNYFSNENTTKPGNRCVIVSEKAPLYFQHDGHSRTIVGIQIKYQRNGVQQHNLLILDPGHRTAALEKSLRENVGWQKFIKRGVHTLKKPQFQLCYVDPGIATGEDMESLKTINSVFLEI